MTTQPTPPTTVYLDIETRNLHRDVPGGWANVEDFGVALAVTQCDCHDARVWLDIPFLAEYAPAYVPWYEKPIRSRPCMAAQIDGLVDFLDEHERIVGFNLIGFDYRTLRSYAPDIYSRLFGKTMDLHADIESLLEHKYSLDNLSKATLAARKSTDGVQSVAWWNSGDIAKIEHYCWNDVWLTRSLHVYGMQHRRVFYTDYRCHERHDVRVEWGTYVREERDDDIPF